MPPRRSIPPPSPARSTRSARSNAGDDDWDRESMASTSFKVPTSRGKNSNTSASIGFKDTSVNIAAAFHAAQTGQHLPLPSEPSFQSHTSSTHKPLSNRSQRAGSQRAKSPAEQLQQAARALSPVRFFLRSTEDENGDFDNSNTYSSFSSMGNGGVGNGSAESYNYAEEEEYVKQAQKAKNRGPGISDTNGKKRKGKALAENLPYRPGEDDQIYGTDSDSDGEGEGIVKGGALDGRAGTRGVRAEKGEGYLGMGLGIQPRQRRKGRKSDSFAEGSDEEQENGYEEADYPHAHSHSQRALSPLLEIPNGRHSRSPTPVQLLRALSPRADRKSPVPTFHPRRRGPGSIRTIITNILHGVVLGLQFIVESVTDLLHSILIRPTEKIFGSSQGVLKRIKQDWWKYVGAIIALNLALRALDAPFRRKGVYKAPDTPPSSIDEVAARITSLEQVTADISRMLRSLSSGEAENKQSTHHMLGRMDDLENALMVETKRVESLRGDGDKGIKALQSSFDSLRAEIKGLGDRVAKSESTVLAHDGRIRAFDNTNQDIHDLQDRVGQVEKKVSDALDDGRLRSALERILPDFVPIRVNSRGTVDIDPKFWNEMKKIMMSRTDTEALVKQALASSGSPTTANTDKVAVELDEKKIKQWAEEVFSEQKSRSPSVEYLTKDDFQNVLDHQLDSLRSELSSIRSSASARSAPHQTTSASKSSVTIKSSKGDDLTSVFNDLIDIALLKYSKDTIARTDYALFTAGARVIPQLTSDTLVLSTATKLGKLVMGSKDVQGRPPATALHPDISVGSCWPFQGSQGSLGVMLTRRVDVSDITIEHAPKELALDMTTAPKVITIMGVVDNEEDKQKLDEYWTQKNESEPAPDHLPLGTITYDINSISNIQTFPIPDEIRELGIKVGIVIFKVESNYGGDFTCLYRVRVHGDAHEERSIEDLD
ncbi:uncharacterized protein I303_103639 [Kwoniella dejecticola CBS 10117]|uniref:SUN domain-containing protein n=1 Tax=Kwoniella dejecticola CBS 10117 TaxID=1296121 RepID=A0A1A6A7B1_9TREE|nr:uncharacterized protein I303_03660 [Kwoniella dejecticola CBS 10117]OBR85945.1 hypothetical protein I303_03660 [Kwoniella dejecticola CBS 10117]